MQDGCVETVGTMFGLCCSFLCVALLGGLGGVDFGAHLVAFGFAGPRFRIRSVGPSLPGLDFDESFLRIF